MADIAWRAAGGKSVDYPVRGDTVLALPAVQPVPPGEEVGWGLEPSVPGWLCLKGHERRWRNGEGCGGSKGLGIIGEKGGTWRVSSPLPGPLHGS